MDKEQLAWQRKVIREEYVDEQKEFRTMPLYQLHKLCQNEDPNALSEWKRRWESDYPKIAEVSKGQGKLIIHYTDK